MRLLLGLIAPLMLSSCAVGPDYQRPASTVPAEFKELKGWMPARPRDHEIPDTWWSLFKDPYLNGLEQQVNVSNQSIAQAEAQFRQAQTLVKTAQAAFSPTVSASASANRFRAASGQNLVVSGVRNLFGGLLSVAWEPDLWGKMRRQLESSENNAQASAATLQALKLSTQALLAQNYFQLRAADAQIKLLGSTFASYEKNLNIIQNRYNAGVIAKADVVQAQTQLASTRAQAIDLGVQRAQLEHAIALLVGKAPAQLTIAPAPLNTLVPAIPLDIPSQLLERRPDIAAAERLAAAANAQIGVAKAAYYPRLNLAVTDGTQANTLANLFMTATNYWALGPAALALPLFDGGLRSSQLASAKDTFAANVAAYRQTVLNGFKEVEDYLAALRILEQEAGVQDSAVALARKSVELTTNQYNAGTVSYVNVVTAQTTALVNEETAVNLQGQRLIAAIQLVKALGGGWDAKDLPSAGNIGGKIQWPQFLPVPP
ncbi:MAG: efflux transporter outer membrane subunit [Methylovulum sp.]|nr:efflux transporter outer membrane subunit [Methylovulum sp.]